MLIICSIINAKLFLYNPIIIPWCIQKGVNLVYMVDQRNMFQVYNVSATVQHFYFDQKSEKILQAFQKTEIFNFFCWLENYWC